MRGYLVNRKYYFLNLDEAFETAKDIIRERYYKGYTCNEEWVITQGEHGGYCVKVNDDWSKVGNIHHLQAAIATIEIKS